MNRAKQILTALPSAPITRFAPSPTGFLHLGHLAHMIYLWGITKSLGGTIVFRLEDHDRRRCTPGFEKALLEDFDWLGFRADKGHTDDFRAGVCAYRQSDCTERYERMLSRLTGDGKTYACDCSRASIRARTGQTRGEIRYDGYCRDRKLPRDTGMGIRLVLPDAPIPFHDAWLGSLEQNPQSDCGDLLIRDRHGHWTYQFAAVCDDLAQNVNLVIRGQDLIDSTGRQIAAGQLMGRGLRPFYLHHPLITDTYGQKLSKRDFGESLRDLREAGQTPEALLGLAAWQVGLLDTPQNIPINSLPELFA